jgi:hypothetical protein
LDLYLFLGLAQSLILIFQQMLFFHQLLLRNPLRADTEKINDHLQNPSMKKATVEERGIREKRRKEMHGDDSEEAERLTFLPNVDCHELRGDGRQPVED